jgi:hypothetical protein
MRRSRREGQRTWAVATTCGGCGVNTNSISSGVREEGEEEDEGREDHREERCGEWRAW